MDILKKSWLRQIPLLLQIRNKFIYVKVFCRSRTWQDLLIFITELKASLRKLEHENADLKFLNNQYVHKVKQLEKESKQKSDRILQLQEKNFQAVVQTPGEVTEYHVTDGAQSYLRV